MKLPCVFLLTVLALAHPAFAQSGIVSKWEKVGPVNFTALVHQSPTRIVATTDYGYLYITDDDGTTWRRQEVDDTCSLDGIAYGDSLHGALIASGNLMLTSDGGFTWHHRNQPAQNLTMVSELGEDTLLVGALTFSVLGQFGCGMIFRSSNAGAHWDTVFIDSGYSYPHKTSFFFGKGFAIGPNFCAETTDAGLHWTTVRLRGGDSSISPLDIDFYSPEAGAIAALEGYYATSDGGKHWGFVPVFRDERTDSYSTVNFFGPASFFMFGTPNANLFTSNDLGATVTPVPMPQASSISVCVRTQSGGWLAVGGGIDPQGLPYGGGGILLRGVLPENATTPSWTVLAECPFYSGVSLHSTNGVTLACVAGSYPLISTDSGIFWHVTDLHDPSYGAMHFPSPDTGYLFYTGSNPEVYGGVNLRTLDSGHTWKPMDISPSYLSAATFGSSDTGYGFAGSLVRTIDGGIHWQHDTIVYSTECPYPGYAVRNNALQTVTSPDGRHAFVKVLVIDTAIVKPGKARYHTAVYRTTDAGATWTPLNIPLRDRSGISRIYFRNASLGFLACDSGRIYRTSDGGNTWLLEQIAPYKYSLNSINFLNDRIGFLTIDTEAVLASTDAGLNWAWLPIPTNHQEIANREFKFVVPPDTFANNSGMSMQEIFFPDSTTVLISFTRALLNVTIPPKITVVNGDTILEYTSVNQGVHAEDYGFYRARLNIPPASSVKQSRPGSHNDLAISIYPNPTHDALRVSLSLRTASAIHIDVLDILGRTVMSASETTTDFPLDVRSLPNGVYALRCSTGSESATTPFTITQ